MSNVTVLAPLALILWVPISGVVFALCRPALAVAIVMIGGMLLLPERYAFDLPVVPPLGKQEIAALCALAGALLRAPRTVRRARPGSRADAAVMALIIAAFFTVLTNRDATAFDPGLTLRDGISMAVRDLLGLGVPFFLGRALIRTRRDLRMLLVVIVAAGLLYSGLMLLETAISPRLHRLIYGYHQASFRNVYRLGGYRPKVFMASGLAAALFATVCAVAAVGLYRVRTAALGIPPALTAAYSIALMFLARGLAAILYGLGTVPVVLLASARAILFLAVLYAGLVVSYPALRMAGLFPTETLSRVATRFNESRGQSLAFRFENEEKLLDRALERPFFGWGGYGRSRVLDQYGRDRSVTDGAWIIQLGGRGFAGWAALFAMFVVPILAAWCTRPAVHGDRRMLGCLSAIVGLYGVDLLLNGLFTNFPIFLAGALLGATGARPRRRPAPRSVEPGV